jgi:hypothetical protein
MVEIGQTEQSATLTAEQAPPPPRRGADQRRDERYAVHGDAEIFVTGGTSMFRGRILNISASGCYVQTVAWVRPAPGTLVELVFVVKGHVVRVRAEARFSESKIGLGLRFVAMEEQMQRRLDGVLGGLRRAMEEKVGSGGAECSVLDVLTATAAARTDAVLKGEEAIKAANRQGFPEPLAEIPKEKQEEKDRPESERRTVDAADFSNLEELGLAPTDALGDADAEALSVMEEMETVAGGTGVGATRVRGSVIEGDRAATAGTGR